MIRRPPRSTLFPTRRSSDLHTHEGAADEQLPKSGDRGPQGGEGAPQTHPERDHRAARAQIADDAERQGGERQHDRSEEHTSELQSPCNLVCRLLLEKKKKKS